MIRFVQIHEETYRGLAVFYDFDKVTDYIRPYFVFNEQHWYVNTYTSSLMESREYIHEQVDDFLTTHGIEDIYE